MKNVYLFLILSLFVSIFGISKEALAWTSINSSHFYLSSMSNKNNQIHLGNYRLQSDNFETIQQAQTSSPDFNNYFWPAMLGTAFQVMFIGVIASSISGKSLFKWGLIGVIAGGVGILLGLISFFALPTIASLAVALIAQSVFMLSYGIDNLIKHGKKKSFSPNDRDSYRSRRRNYFPSPILRF